MKKITFTNSGASFKHSKPPLVSKTINVGNNKVNSPFTLALGSNNVVTGGYQNTGSSIALGHYNGLHSANNVIVIGESNIISPSKNVTVNGSGNNIAGSYHLVTGIGNTVEINTYNCTVNGNANLISNSSNFAQINGSGNVIGISASSCLIFGNYNTIPDGFTNVTIIGSNITATQSNSYIFGPPPKQQQGK